MDLQQTVDRRARQLILGHHTLAFKQAADRPDGTAWVVAFGREDGLLNLGVDLRLPPIRADLGGQRVDTVPAPGIVPGLDRLLAQEAVTRAGYVVVACSQLVEGRFEFAALQFGTADQRTQYRVAEQGHGMDVIHRILL